MEYYTDDYFDMLSTTVGMSIENTNEDIRFFIKHKIMQEIIDYRNSEFSFTKCFNLDDERKRDYKNIIETADRIIKIIEELGI